MSCCDYSQLDRIILVGNVRFNEFLGYLFGHDLLVTSEIVQTRITL